MDLARLKQEQDQIADENSRYIERLTDYKTGLNWETGWARQGKPPPRDEHLLKDQIKDLRRQWALTLFDTAQSMSETKAKLMMNEEENELLLDRMGHLVVMNQYLEREGVDAENSSTAQLAQVANRLYDDLAKASYREAKLNQMLRIFRDVQMSRQRGDVIPQLTGPRPVLRHERSGRREARQRSQMAREMGRANAALQAYVPSQQLASQTPVPVEVSPHPSPLCVSQRRTHAYEQPPSVAVLTPQQPTPEQDQRVRVINFIKHEIQPLYDTEQITKKRFIDIVARTSTAFLESRPMLPQLSVEDQQWLQRKIQEVITLQDEARSRRRAARESRVARDRTPYSLPRATTMA